MGRLEQDPLDLRATEVMGTVCVESERARERATEREREDGELKVFFKKKNLSVNACV
jgi:hypothetical protein